MATWVTHLSWLDVVRDFFPDATDTEARDILWTQTSYLTDDSPDHSRMDLFRQELSELRSP